MPDPTTTFTTASVIGIAAGSSVLAAFVTQGLTMLRDRFTTRRDGTFSALYLAAQLESYASLSATYIGDNETHDGSDGHAGTAHGNVPDLSPYNQEIDWKALKIAVTDAALSFRVEVESTQAMITDAWDIVGDEDFVLPTVYEETARLGQKALQMATALRAKWKIPPVTYPNKNWNVRDHLAERLAHYVEQRRKTDESNRELWAGLNDAISTVADALKPEVKPPPHNDG